MSYDACPLFTSTNTTHSLQMQHIRTFEILPHVNFRYTTSSLHSIAPAAIQHRCHHVNLASRSPPIHSLPQLIPSAGSTLLIPAPRELCIHFLHFVQVVDPGGAGLGCADCSYVHIRFLPRIQTVIFVVVPRRVI